MTSILLLLLILSLVSWLIYELWQKFRPINFDNKNISIEHETFKLTHQHLSLVRASIFYWNPDIEAGHLRLHPIMPFGSRNFFRSMKRITGITHTLELKKLYEEMSVIFFVFFRNAKLKKGKYEYTYLSGRKLKKQDITITDDHLKLIYGQAPFLQWSRQYFPLLEKGRILSSLGRHIPGPGFDVKRPYGYFSAFEIEMAELLGWSERLVKNSDNTISFKNKEDTEALFKLHNEMHRAYQCFVQNADLKPGNYDITCMVHGL